MKSVVAIVVAFALPAVASAASPKEGARLYGRYCAMCHGPNGEGQTTSPPARFGGGPARDQKLQPGLGPSLRGVGAAAADFYLRTGYMPLRRADLQPRRSRLLLGPGEIDALIAYVASLGAGPPVPQPHPQRGDISAGLQLFTEHCAGCHQVVAEGGYVTDVVPPPLEDDSPVQIAEAVRIGPYVMPRFTKKSISDAQLDSIIRYVDYAKHPDDRGGWALGHIGPVPEGLVTWFIAATLLLALCLVLGRRLHE